MSFKKITTSSSSSLKKFSISDRDVLNKRVQVNPRYAKVKCKTNSGFNTKRKEELEKEIRKYYKVKNNEVFQRISLSDLLQLMVAFVEESKEKESLGADDLAEGESPHEVKLPCEVPNKGNFFSVESQVLPSNLKNNKDNLPFLLMDVRTAPEYVEGHLATAVCHPYFKMSRAVGWESANMLTYKNHAEWIVIVYDECENLAPEVAATLVNRGYSNTFMLSGGLRLAQDKIGPPLITDDQTLCLSDELVEFVAEQLLFIQLPPLLLEEASDWWAENNSVYEGVEPVTVNRGNRQPPSSNRIYDEAHNKKPWR